MEIRSKAVGDLDVEWESGSNESSNQTDGHSCGPFVLLVIISCFSLINNALNSVPSFWENIILKYFISSVINIF